MRWRGLVLALGVVAGMLLAGPPPVSAEGPHRCECVEFIKRTFGLSGAAGNAKDMEPYLAARGFRRLAGPVPGAVAVFQPGLYSGGPGSIYGHVAIVVALTTADSRTWAFTARSANQTGAQYTAYTCSNVSVKGFGPFPRGSRLISYWLPP